MDGVIKMTWDIIKNTAAVILFIFLFTDILFRMPSLRRYKLLSNSLALVQLVEWRFVGFAIDKSFVEFLGA